MHVLYLLYNQSIHFEYLMRSSTSKEKLSQMHMELDRELEMAGFPMRAKTKRDQLRYVSQETDNKKSTLSNISNKPVVYEYEVSDKEINNRKSDIGDLQRKLMELQKKMNHLDVQSSGEEVDRDDFNQKLSFDKKIDSKPNEDTARFLVGNTQERNPTKFTLECPSLNDQEDEEDSEDYFQIQQVIQKRKAEQKISKQKKNNEKDTMRERRQSKERKNHLIVQEDTERKISVQTESALRPKYSKYSTEKSNRSIKGNQKRSVGKASVRDSVVSRKSVQKSKPLPRTNSRGSLRSGDSMRKGNSRSRQKMNRSIDRSQRGEEGVTRAEELEIAKDIKRTANLEKQLQHYKRLSQKYKQQLEDYKVMQIQFRELKKNFAKSELIRSQQKKIIEGLKSKMNK